MNTLNWKQGALAIAVMSITLWMLMFAAFASQGGEGNNTGCNGVGNVNSPCQGAGGQGGSGGQGGTGGQGGIGIGVAISGSASSATAVARGGRAVARGGSASSTGGSGGQGGQGGGATSQANGGQGGNASVTVQGAGGAGGTSTPSSITVRNVPDVYAPGISGGTNPCTNSLTGGGAVAGFGVSLGGSWSDQDCERRNLSALLYNQGQADMALEVLCETTAVRQARLRLGRPCAADRPQVVAASPVPVQTAPERIRPAYCRPGIANSECN